MGKADYCQLIFFNEIKKKKINPKRQPLSPKMQSLSTQPFQNFQMPKKLK